eukprot:6188290-Pleurochrysis_carterae.AAC.6
MITYQALVGVRACVALTVCRRKDTRRCPHFEGQEKNMCILTYSSRLKTNCQLHEMDTRKKITHSSSQKSTSFRKKYLLRKGKLDCSRQLAAVQLSSAVRCHLHMVFRSNYAFMKSV